LCRIGFFVAESLKQSVVRFLSTLRIGGERHQAVARVFLVRASGAAIQFLFFLLLAKQIGAEGFGLFSLGYAFLLIAASIARWGVDQIALRHMSAHAEDNERSLFVSVFAHGVLLVAGFGLAVTCVSLLVWMAWGIDTALLPFVLAILPFSLLFYLAECMRARDMQLRAAALQVLMVPLGALLIMVLSADISLFDAVSAFMISCVFMCVSGYVFWCYRECRGMSFRWERKQLGTLLTTATPVALAVVVSTWLGFSETVMLGLFRSREEVAGYSAALRALFLFGFIIAAVNNVLSPRFAVLFRQDSWSAILATVKRAGMLTLMVATPLLVLFFIFAEDIMNIFGDAFVDAAPVLRILLLGQLILSLSGTLGTALIMCGHEQTFKRIIVLSAIFNLLLSPFFVWAWGGNGAAASAVATIAVANIMCLGAVRHMCRVQKEYVKPRC